MMSKKYNWLYLKFLFLSFIFIGFQNNSNKSTIKSLFGVSISSEKVDNFIDNQMLSLNIPSLSIAIINNGEVVYHRVKGYSNKEQKILSDKNSIFEGASNSIKSSSTKVITKKPKTDLEIEAPSNND